MRRRVIAAGIVVMALTTCCRAAQGPAEVVKEFLDQCKAGEVDKAKGHVYEIEGDHPEAGETSRVIEGLGRMLSQGRGMTVLDTKENGTAAACMVQMRLELGEQYLVRVGNEWKLILVGSSFERVTNLSAQQKADLAAVEKWTQQMVAAWKKRQGSAPAAQRELDSRLMLAAMKGQVAEIRQAIADGADVNGGGRDSDEPLRAAAGQGQVEAMRVLVAAGANVDSAAGSLLPDAIQRKGSEVARALIELGADVNRESRRGKPLEIAVAEGKAELAKLLLEKGARVPVYEKAPASQPSRRGDMPAPRSTPLLNVAAGSGDYETFAMVRRMFPDVSAADAESLTALHMVGVRLSGGKDRVKIVQELLGAGLDPHAIAQVRYARVLEKGDWTPLGTAVAWSSSEVALELLQRAKYSPEELTQSLYGAAKGCSAEVVEEMLRQGAKVAVTGKQYDSALNAAVWRRDIKKVRLLLDHGAAVDVVLEPQKRTALLNAVACSTPEVVEELLKRGADPKRKDASGNDAAALAEIRVNKGREVEAGKRYYPEFTEDPDDGRKIAAMITAAGKR